jgi:WD40 repeat protein
VSWGFDRVIRRWEAATGKQLGAFPVPPRTTLAALSPDGETIALANVDKTIRLLDTATGQERQQFKGHENGIAAMAFAPGGKVLASRGSGDNIIRLHDVAKGTELRDIVVTPPRPAGDGVVFVIGGGGRASPGTGPGVAFSPDGNLLVAPLAAGGDPSRTLVFFDATSGKELRKIESPQPIASFAFSPDGRTLAAENANRTITLWEVISGKERGQLGKAPAEQPQAGGGRMELNVVIDGLAGGFGEPGGPVGVTYSPDGRALAVRGPDRSVRIWDVTEGKEINRLPGHTGRIETVAFAPDGKTLASGATDTTILLWDAASARKGLSQPQTVSLAARDLESLWSDLAGEDATKALQSAHKLTAGSAQAAAFLSKHLQPAARVDPEKIKGWIADLDSEQFAVRQEASGNLLKVGEQAVPALQELLNSTPPLETRKRAESLVYRLTSGTLTSEQLRLVRAVESLERMGTPEARRLLQTLSEGAAGTLTTREALAALKRFGR